MTAYAPINSATLRWARQQARLDEATLAKQLGTTEARVREFEAGTRQPTMHQLLLLGKKLDRTPAFFFTNPPQRSDIPDTVDFRGHSSSGGEGGTPLPPRLVRDIRRAESYRETILELEGTPTPAIVTGPINREKAEQRAAELRTRLGLAEHDLPATDPLSTWLPLLDANGYLIFHTDRVPLSVFRGLSIHHHVLPIILLNGADSPQSRAFTLFHEVAHLANRTSGMCDLESGRREEAIANAFAASVLMPRNHIENVIVHREDTPADRASAIARKFRVSLLAAAVRLRTLGQISEEELEILRAESNRRWQENRATQTGHPPAWRIRYRNLGSRYIGTIARAFDEGRLDLLDASHLLDSRLKMTEQMIDRYRETEGSWEYRHAEGA